VANIFDLDEYKIMVVLVEQWVVEFEVKVLVFVVEVYKLMLVEAWRLMLMVEVE
jgi:hypothetical protein